MLGFTFNTDRTKLDAAMTSLVRSINDWSPAWPVVAETIRGMAREQFESEGARGASGAWPALSVSYAKAKARRYPGQPVLRATGRLYNSLAGSGGSGDESVLEARPRGLTVGTRVEYAAYHQSSAPRSRLPRRPVFDFLPGTADARIVAVLRSTAQQAGRRAGLEVAGAAGASGNDTAGGLDLSGAHPGEIGRPLAGGPAAPLSRGL